MASGSSRPFSIATIPLSEAKLLWANTPSEPITVHEGEILYISINITFQLRTLEEILAEDDDWF